jgi:hypothetical protein
VSDHDHCDHDPTECTYDALVGEYRKAAAHRDALGKVLANMAECAHDANMAEPMCACPCHLPGGLTAERDRLRAVVKRLIEIDDRRAAVVVATQHEDIDVGVRATVPIMAEYRAVMLELRELLDVSPTREDT